MAPGLAAQTCCDVMAGTRSDWPEVNVPLPLWPAISASSAATCTTCPICALG